MNEAVATTSAHDSDDNFSDTSDDTDYFKSDNESDSDANKSDSDVYFKSDDFDSDDEYDHELHERLTREEMTRIAKLEDKENFLKGETLIWPNIYFISEPSNYS